VFLDHALNSFPIHSGLLGRASLLASMSLQQLDQKTAFEGADDDFLGLFERGDILVS
jgi:hypothetical protein